MPALSNCLVELQGGGVSESLHLEFRIKIGGREVHGVKGTRAKSHIDLIPSGILVKVAGSHDKQRKKESCVIVLIEIHGGFPLEDTILEARLSGKMRASPISTLGLLAAISRTTLAEILRELGLQSSLSRLWVVRERGVNLDVVWIVPSPTRHVLIELHGVAESVVGVSGGTQGSFVILLKVSLLIGTSQASIGEAKNSC